jgi:hypothetical protein
VTDCGASGCRYRDRSKPGGMRPVRDCQCDVCPVCGGVVRPGRPVTHYEWCSQPEWVPEHQRTQEVEP